MYLDPFAAGVASTLFVEMAIVIIYAILTSWRKK